MPLYYDIKVGPEDTPSTRTSKKRIADGLLRLRRALDEHLFGDDTERPDSTKVVRLATWNLREFSPKNKFGERLDDAYWFIAEILCHFDLIAIQEVRDNLGALEAVMCRLGGHWQYIVTDVTEGIPGNRERMAFLYNTDKVSFRNIAGEVTLQKGRKILKPHGVRLSSEQGFSINLPQQMSLEFPDNIKTKTRNGHLLSAETSYLDLPAGTTLNLTQDTRVIVPSNTPVNRKADGSIHWDSTSRLDVDNTFKLELPTSYTAEGMLQFARTPYTVAFQAQWLKLMLCTVHIYYGSGDAGIEQRNMEIQRLTEFLADRARSENDSDADNFFFVLGDFNIVGKQHSTFDSLTSNDFVVPEDILEIPEGTNVKRDKFYDQIAYWSPPRHKRNEPVKVEVKRAGVFDFFKHVYRMGDDDPDNREETVYSGLMDEKFRKASAAGETRAHSWKYKEWRTYQMSDHLPMWVELRIDFSDEYLKEIIEK